MYSSHFPWINISAQKISTRIQTHLTLLSHGLLGAEYLSIFRIYRRAITRQAKSSVQLPGTTCFLLREKLSRLRSHYINSSLRTWRRKLKYSPSIYSCHSSKKLENQQSISLTNCALSGEIGITRPLLPNNMKRLFTTRSFKDLHPATSGKLMEHKALGLKSAVNIPKSLEQA